MRKNLKKMIIKFSIENVLSIKDRQTLDLSSVKTCKERSLENTFCDNGLTLLKSVAIYGANASGKSNIMAALRDFKNLILNSAKESQSGENLRLMPFLLNPKNQDEPSSFEMEFTIAEDRYRYGFDATREKVIKEWLFKTPIGKSKESALYLRSVEKEEDVITPGALWGDVDINGLKGKTRANSLFLSVCAAWAVKEAEKIIRYFGDDLKILFCENRNRREDETTIYLKDSRNTESKTDIYIVLQSERECGYGTIF